MSIKSFVIGFFSGIMTLIGIVCLIGKYLSKHNPEIIVTPIKNFISILFFGYETYDTRPYKPNYTNYSARYADYARKGKSNEQQSDL